MALAWEGAWIRGLFVCLLLPSPQVCSPDPPWSHTAVTSPARPDTSVQTVFDSRVEAPSKGMWHGECAVFSHRAGLDTADRAVPVERVERGSPGPSRHPWELTARSQRPSACPAPSFSTCSWGALSVHGRGDGGAGRWPRPPPGSCTSPTRGSPERPHARCGARCRADWARAHAGQHLPWTQAGHRTASPPAGGQCGRLVRGLPGLRNLRPLPVQSGQRACSCHTQPPRSQQCHAFDPSLR